MGTDRQSLKIVAPAANRSSGSIRGMGETLATEEFSGVSSMTVPLHLPQGRGLQPALELGYRSSAGNGSFGMGFDLPTGSVQRSTTRSAPRYQLDDIFVHSSYGELVYLAGADSAAELAGVHYTVRNYRPRQEGSFPSVQWWIGPAGSFWQSVDRDNISSVYGSDPSSQIADPAAPDRVFSWLLQETFDARGNHVLQEYRAEDQAGVPPSPAQGAGRSTAARYPSRSCWANAEAYGSSMVLTMSQQQRAELDWHFQLLWNYGEYAEDGQLVANWLVRPDPFSTYQAGFEIRYYRLCQSLLVLHHFPDELGAAPLVTGALRLRYDLNPFASRLIRAEQAGFRTDGDQPRSAVLAPIQLGWSDFVQDGGSYRELDFAGQPPTVLADAELHWVDLDGVGIPGVLLAAEDGLRFWQPSAIDPQLATVRYTGPRTIETAPLGASEDPDAAAYTLVDVTGAGRPQWLGTSAGVPGYAELGPDGASGPVRFFDTFPTDYADPLAEQVNVTGTGLADLVLVGATEVAWTPSLGAAGYGTRQLTPGTGLPPATPPQPGEVRQFADVLGSGQQHYVRIRNGSVTCWPNLGFGRFGDPIELADAPFLEPDFDPARLFVLDLDGSGAADLAYRYPWHVRIWRNYSGNGFAEPFDVQLPAGADSAAQVDFADVLGTGISCLVVTQPGPQTRHWTYVFGDGGKPYLLTDIDNGLGQQSSIEYTTSARQRLNDPDPGAPELGVPPFPVHLTARVRHHDLLADSTSISSWRYRHGYYDADECSFTGFGFVERQDSEVIEDGSNTPPLMVRSWYHNGAAPAGGSVESLYRAEYFAGDPDSYLLPESVLDLPPDSGCEGVRQALYNLVGKLLHEETYGLDGSALQPLPYQVTGTRYLCTPVSPLGGNPASFFSRPLEAIDYDYERNAADPRVSHTFTLAVDGYGNPTSECDLHYPRRPGNAGPAAQAALLATLTSSEYLNVTEPFRLLGVPADQRENQLGGLTVPAGGYFDLAALTAQLPSATSTLTGWLRYSYVPDPDGAALAPQRLLVAVEQAEHDRAVLEQAYEHVLNPTELAALLTATGPAGGALQAGTGEAAPYWWNPGEQRGYADSSGFYRPRTSVDAFGNTVTATDDPYCLLVASITDPLGNTTTATVDYQAMDYCRITDPNGSVAEAGFDPLAIVQVTASYGSEGGQAVGFAPLAHWQRPAGQPSVAEVLADPSGYLQQAAGAFCYDALAWTGYVPANAFDQLQVATAALWSDLVQRGYLSPAGTICLPFRLAVTEQDFALDSQFTAVTAQVQAIIAGQPDGSPVRGLLLSATEYPGFGSSPIVFRLAYYDGWQRLLQAKLRSDPAASDQAWQTSGTVHYDAKGQVIRQFEPFFTASADYAPTDQAGLGVSSLLHYDAPGRLIRTDTPLQTFRATAYGWQLSDPPSAWSVAVYDENDTLLQSRYYADLMSAPTPDPWEKQVVEGAALCTDSPSRSCFDPMRRVVRTVAQDSAIVTAEQLQPLGYDQAQSQQLLTDLLTAGYLDDQSRFTPAFTPQSAGWSVRLPAPFDTDAAGITALLASLQRSGTLLITDLVLDPSGNPATVADPRLGAAGLANYLSVWSLTGADVYTVSADAGSHWRLRNAAGNVVWQCDGAGTVTTTGYDQLQRPISQLAGAGGPHPTGILGIYGDSLDPAGQPYFTEPQHWNLRGRLVVALDASGLALGPFHSILGLPYAQSRALRADTSTVPDWATITQQVLGELCTAIAALTGPADLAGLVLPAALQALLDPAPYVELTGYDALGQTTRITDADGNRVDYSLDLRGLVQAARFQPVDTALAATEIGPISYDAHDRPTGLTVPGVLRTSLEYHPLTFLLTGIRTVSLALPAPADPVRQALTYYHDPVGNVGITLDAAAVPIPPGPAPAGAYSYSPLYQLLTATGREGSSTSPVPYRENYRYDDGGNLIAVTHTGATDWQRSFAVAPDSNRLTGDVSYNLNGGVLSFPGVASMSWTSTNQLGSVRTAPAADGSYSQEYSAYAASGTRTRRVTSFHTGGQPESSEQVSYPGLLEIVRQQASDGSVLEWHTTRLGAGPLQLGRWIAWFEGTPAGAQAGMRFPLLDNLGSVVGELDEQGEPLTSEKYQPFGGDALTWSATPLDAELQRERYSAKELDQGRLYYYGARHYSPALMRWTSPDPAGPIDSLNLYQFVANNPISYADSGGRMKIFHWNVHDKNPAGLTGNAFVADLGVLLGEASSRDKQGTVVFLTEIMASVTNAHFQNLVDALNRKSGGGWSGRAVYTGMSEGGTRRERIGILTHNVTVENYWHMIRESPYSRSYVMERQVGMTAFTKRHSANSRYPVGVRLRTQMGGQTNSIDIGGYHNQGPSSGATTRASEVIGEATRLGVHVLIGDFNTEPATKRRRGDDGETVGMRTRRSGSREAVTESNMASSRGGSLYDRAMILNSDLGGRDLTARNETGSRGRSSDHNSNSTVLNTRKRRRED